MAAFQQISPGQKSKGFRCTSIPMSTWVWIMIVIAEFVHYVHLALTVEQGKP